MRPDLTLAAYRLTLERLFGFYAPTEERLRAIGEVERLGVDLGRRARARLLERDLAQLGVGEPPPLVPRDALGWLATVEDAFGCLYVLEGSTLGGRLVIRRVSETLGVTPLRGGAFFHGHGEQTDELWRAFAETLRGFVNTAEREERVLRAAVATFERLLGWFSPAR